MARKKDTDPPAKETPKLEESVESVQQPWFEQHKMAVIFGSIFLSIALIVAVVRVLEVGKYEQVEEGEPEIPEVDSSYKDAPEPYDEIAVVGKPVEVQREPADFPCAFIVQNWSTDIGLQAEDGGCDVVELPYLPEGRVYYWHKVTGKMDNIAF